MYDNPAVLAQITALQGLGINELRTKWQELYKREPSRSANSMYLRKRLAYRIQELAYGGDSAETEARLAEAVKQYGIDRPGKHKRKHSIKLPPAGTILTREYHGVEHQVAVLEDGGFQYNGCRYKSLSAIAKHITGMSWSGNLFFGLKEKSGKRS